MNASTAATPLVRAAFSHLIDYAGLFPPAQLTMDAALQGYEESRGSSHAWMLGRFITPASRMEELRSMLRPSHGRIRLSVIFDAAADRGDWMRAIQAHCVAVSEMRANEPRLCVESLEVPLPPLATLRDSYDASIGQCAMLAERGGLRDLPIFVEFPRDSRWAGALSDTMSALKRYRLGAKMRCGGTTADAVPSAAQTAAFISAATECAVPFKATAGLHHPIRHYDDHLQTKMHGFLNILAAVALAPDAQEATLAAILEEERAERFSFESDEFVVSGRRLSLQDIVRARASFVAYGSCSFSEPVDDLIALSILPK
ncbi:MAG: hypothetical protein M3R51_10905 [Candidatus Eremiobacteraeota bacterium]|nr:hypothetical protein [Candidatus Eremiobacteraeota bacterium]